MPGHFPTRNIPTTFYISGKSSIEEVTTPPTTTIQVLVRPKTASSANADALAPRLSREREREMCVLLSHNVSSTFPSRMLRCLIGGYGMYPMRGADQ